MNSSFGSYRSPKTIALVGKYHSLEIAESLRRLAEYLHERGVSVFIERETAEHIGRQVDLSRWVTCGFNDIGAHADLAIVIGGDGTMLNAARRLARYRVPLVGVNQGRLGFMTDIGRDDMLTCMDDLLDGRFAAENRMLLDADVIRRPERLSGDAHPDPRRGNQKYSRHCLHVEGPGNGQDLGVAPGRRGLHRQAGQSRRIVEENSGAALI